MSRTEYEPTEIEYIEQLMDDLDLKGSNTLDDLINALEKEDTDQECRDEVPAAALGWIWFRATQVRSARFLSIEE